MNLRQIEVFRAVMQAGSITGAARLLHALPISAVLPWRRSDVRRPPPDGPMIAPAWLNLVSLRVLTIEGLKSATNSG